MKTKPLLANFIKTFILKTLRGSTLLLLCSSLIGSNVYSRSFELVPCTAAHWSDDLNCNNNNYYVCVSNSQSQISQSNNQLSDLRQEQVAIHGRINSCMGELLSFSRSESDRRSDLVQSSTKVEGLKSTKSQIENLKNNQESFFLSLDEEINALGKALPEIAIRLNDLIVRQNTKIESIINDLSAQLASTQDSDEMERIDLDIEIFKKLKIAQSRFASNDPLAFNNLVKDALYGEGDRKLKAISSFDPLTYLVLKTVLATDSSSSGSVGLSELKNQMRSIRNDMNNFIQRQESDLALEEQKSAQYASNYQEALNNRANKENECKGLEERSNLLPQLIEQANAGVSGSNSLLAGCSRFCSKTWVPRYCESH